ncbi:hypothetical protein T492DRAFT_1126092 [Pavlovales sp. CCMP2436]|nr:hypothetical protein T492DRAFT_1126092 [Pavlovales sp. CCMP2436]
MPIPSRLNSDDGGGITSITIHTVPCALPLTTPLRPIFLFPNPPPHLSLPNPVGEHDRGIYGCLRQLAAAESSLKRWSRHTRERLCLDNLDNFLEVITGEGVVKKPKFHPAVTATNLPLEKQAADDGCLVVGRVQLSEGAWMAVLQDKRITTLKFGSYIEEPEPSQGWQVLWDTLAIAVFAAAKWSDGHLLIDVIGNGGGDIELGVAIQYFLFRDMPGAYPFKDMRDACDAMDYPKTPLLQMMVDALNNPTTQLANVPDPMAALARVVKLADMVTVSIDALIANGGEDAETLAILKPEFGSVSVCTKEVIAALEGGAGPASQQEALEGCLAPMRDALRSTVVYNDYAQCDF